MTDDDGEKTRRSAADAQSDEDELTALFEQLERRVDRQIRDLAEFLAHHRRRSAEG